MAYRKRKRLSVWALLNRLGLTGDHDDIIEHVFTTASRLTFRSDDGKPIDGGDFLVGVFESLGTSTESPGVGTPEWKRLRTVALRKVVARLSRDGLLDSIAVGSAAVALDMDADCETNSDSPAAKEKGSALGSASDSADAMDGEREVETPATTDDGPDRREGVEVFMAMLRRGPRNGDGPFTCVERDTPYLVLVQWAKETCPGASAKSLGELMDGLREVRWWDNDGHIQGAEMLRVLESELEAGRDNEEWMLVVSDFEDAVGRLRGVFERLSLL